jgi:hypothetical protein
VKTYTYAELEELARRTKLPEPLTFWWRRDTFGDHLLWLLPRAGSFEGPGDGRFVCARLSRRIFSKRWDAWDLSVRPRRDLHGGLTKLRCSLKEAKVEALRLYNVAAAKVRLGVVLPEWRSDRPGVW